MHSQVPPGLVLAGRRVGQRNHQNGEQRGIVIVPLVVVDDCIQIIPGPHGPPSPQVDLQIGHWPLEESRSDFDGNKHEDEAGSQRPEKDAVQLGEW